MNVELIATYFRSKWGKFFSSISLDTKILLVLLALVLCWNACSKQNCVPDKIGIIVKIEKYGKHGGITVRFSETDYQYFKYRRPYESLIGQQYCTCK